MVRFTRFPGWSYPNFLHRLPDHYYKHRMDLSKPSTRVHDVPPESDLLELKYHENLKRVIRIPDVPVEVSFPKEADLGLWGGEGIVKGYIKPRKYFQAGWPRPRYWFPNLKRATLYSEILDKHFSIVCTERTLTIIDRQSGLDSYILRTDVQDFKSQMALLLRRKMLLTLIKKEFKNDAHEKEMLAKYGEFIIPLEEAEWFGLPVSDAVIKQKVKIAKENVKPPLKYELTKKLLENLKDKKDIEIEPKPTGWMDKVKSKLGLKPSV